MRRSLWERLLSLLPLALVAYVPLLLTARGKVAADTKTYLYLDPGRLLSRAWSMWDPNIGLGTVTHQTIGYLWPMGPWFWIFDQLGVPDWVAQRLWVGTVMFAAGAGLVYLLRTDALRRNDLYATRSRGYGFMIETAYRMHRGGARIEEVPVTFVDRVRGQSKLSLGVAVEELALATGWGLRDLVLRRR